MKKQNIEPQNLEINYKNEKTKYRTAKFRKYRTKIS